MSRNPDFFWDFWKKEIVGPFLGPPIWCHFFLAWMVHRNERCWNLVIRHQSMSNLLRRTFPLKFKEYHQKNLESMLNGRRVARTAELTMSLEYVTLAQSHLQSIYEHLISLVRSLRLPDVMIIATALVRHHLLAIAQHNFGTIIELILNLNSDQMRFDCSNNIYFLSQRIRILEYSVRSTGCATDPFIFHSTR